MATGDPDQRADSLFGKPVRRKSRPCRVYPAHDYKGRSQSTLGAELADNPRLQKHERQDFTRMMRELNLAAPSHLTEALRTNMTGGKTVDQMLAEAAQEVPFIGLGELDQAARPGRNIARVGARRARGTAFKAGHIPGARHLPPEPWN